MSDGYKLIRDRYVGELEIRSNLAYKWFKAILEDVGRDLKGFESLRYDNLFTYKLLDIHVATSPEQDDPKAHPAELTLSTKFSKVRLIANDPPGYLSIELSKKSALFDGILFRGAIKVDLIEGGTKGARFLFFDSEWMNAEGQEYPSNCAELAERLLDVLLLPLVHEQIAAANKLPR